MSRSHAEIYDDDGEWVVKDLGSSNHTFINEERVKEAAFEEGDVLKFGNFVVECRWREDEAEAAPEPEPEPDRSYGERFSRSPTSTGQEAYRSSSGYPAENEGYEEDFDDGYDEPTSGEPYDDEPYDDEPYQDDERYDDDEPYDDENAEPLVLLYQDARGRTLELRLEGDTAVTVGRAPESVLRTTDRTVARSHARIYQSEGCWWVKDLASTNGTTVNGDSIMRSDLRAGDEIQFGRFVVHVKAG